MKTHKSLAAVSFTLLLLAACSSGMGDIYGGGSNARTYEIRGVVDSVDPNNRSVYLTNVSGYTSMLSGGGGSTARVYYDDQTEVQYQGASYRPEDLERGDEVTVRVDESGNRLHADSMTVTYDATGNSSSVPTTGTPIRGTVTYVDTSRRQIEIDRGTSTPLVVDYDTNTRVYYNNRTYSPADLERGDQVELRLQKIGTGVRAQDITVTRSVSGSTLPSNSYSTLRGTVSYVDTSRRAIELDAPSWISGFRSGSTSSSRMTVYYDANASVDVQGRLYPVSNLERGDVIEVQVNGNGGSTLQANRIVLVRDVNAR